MERERTLGGHTNLGTRFLSNAEDVDRPLTPLLSRFFLFFWILVSEFTPQRASHERSANNEADWTRAPERDYTPQRTQNSDRQKGKQTEQVDGRIARKMFEQDTRLQAALTGRTRPLVLESTSCGRGCLIEVMPSINLLEGVHGTLDTTDQVLLDGTPGVKVLDAHLDNSVNQRRQKCEE